MPLTGDLGKLTNLASRLRTIGGDTLRQAMPEYAARARSLSGSLGAPWPRVGRRTVSELSSEGFALTAEAEQASSLSRLKRLDTTTQAKPIDQVPPPMLEAFDEITHRIVEKKLTNI